MRRALFSRWLHGMCSRSSVAKRHRFRSREIAFETRENTFKSRENSFKSRGRNASEIRGTRVQIWLERVYTSRETGSSELVYTERERSCIL